MKYRRLIYTSQPVKQFSGPELIRLLHDARAYNSIDDICGVLLHRHGYFLQVIEGGIEPIENLLSRLRKDVRHKNIVIIYDGMVGRRVFSNWDMGVADLMSAELSLLPGICSDLSASQAVEELIVGLPDLENFLQQKTA
ncbi:BLUF domain-containing protein [Flavobacteriales bacterium]|nr:BLUF domain-containing protein [Flavobacteriales bacterium]